MAIRYFGNQIIHEYKGIEIEKVVKHYSQGDETFYRVENTNKIFYKLKDAKHYIDNDLITTDYTAYGGKRQRAEYDPSYITGFASNGIGEYE
jgi:hypothetical protein